MTKLLSHTGSFYTVVATLSPDRMKLFVAGAPKGQGICTVDELVALFAPHVRSTDDLDRDVLKDVALRISNGENVTDRRIAKGTPPERGRDGRLVVLVKPFTGKGEVEIDGKGLAHFNRLHLFDNVSPGQVVARIYPPHDGTPGRDALGLNVSAPPGKPVKFSSDSTLRLNRADGFEEVVAEVAGYLVQDDTRLRISSTLEISGDLDLGYGSLSFVGSVTIGGNVSPELSIIADGSIEVRGGVQGASLVSKHGDVTVRGFMHGAGKGEIVCSGTFTGRLLQEVSVEAGTDIVVLKEAIDCCFRAQEAIRAVEGRIVGGTAYFVRGVDIHTIGNDQEVTTMLYPSSSIRMSSEFGRIEVELENHEKAIELMKLHLGPLAYEPMRVEVLKGAHRTKMESLLTKYKAVRQSRARLAVKREEMLQRGIVADRVVITVRGKMHPGTVIQGIKEVFRPREAVVGPVSIIYTPADDSFAVQTLQEIPKQSKERERDDGRRKKK